jgi:iron complex outermembrane receptor protein
MRRANHWIYKAGVIVKPFKSMDGVALFYNYSETFTPLIGTNLAGVPYKDTTGKVNEIGVKLEMPQAGIVMTASAFKQENTDFPVSVYNAALQATDTFQIGTGVDRGVEADIAWQPSKNLAFLFAASSIDARNPPTINGIVGTRKRNVQLKPNYRFVGKYTFTTGPLTGLSAGVGLVTISDRYGDGSCSFMTQGYQTVDLFCSYVVNKHWTAQANIRNLFDKAGIESSIHADFAQVQDPRSAILTLRYTF